MFEDTRMDNLTTPFEPFRVVAYNKNQTKALHKNKSLQLITGSIYRGETIKEEYNDYCDVYACYEGAPVGIWIGCVRTDFTVAKVTEQVTNKNMDSLENYLEDIKTRLEKQDHFRFTELKFIRHIAPELEGPMQESNRVFEEDLRKKVKEREAKRKAEKQAFRAEQNEKSELVVSKAIEILKNGGNLSNQTLTFYRGESGRQECSIINYLMRRYGVNVPLRTQGWINEKLLSVTIEDGECKGLQYCRVRGAQCSRKFFECMDELVAKVAEDGLAD